VHNPVFTPLVDAKCLALITNAWNSLFAPSIYKTLGIAPEMEDDLAPNAEEKHQK